MKKLARILILVLPLTLACGGDDDEKSSGTLQITAQIEPSPPQVGRNVLHLHVRDASGEGVEGAAITVEPFMPSMGHGSSETPVVIDRGGGDYLADPVTFTMPGPWEVRIEAKAGGESGRLVLDWTVGTK